MYRKYLLTLIALISFSFLIYSRNTVHPNVILIITDDQGYGDFGFTGNPHVQTPVLDKFAGESVRFNNFYVSPVCAPTRSSLMTGRFSLRTGVRDTYNGGAIMAAEEVTIAEMLKDAGYTTGMFGKWHLGDNYPFRPIDQGFDEAVMHLSGGMGQVGDFTTWFKGDSSYFDPVLWHNGKMQQYQGYCTDIFAGEAIRFIEKNREKPFFCYLAFNAPHTPLQVPDEYYQRFKNIDPASGFENDNRPFPEMSEKDREDARKVYAMVACIDDNIGRLLQKLEELKLDQNTMVLFMTDNGPQQNRYIAGMRGKKGSVYRGGVRVPLWIRYPAEFAGNMENETNTAHIDILPTLAEICRAKIPGDRIIDGKSLVPLMKGKTVDWADRTLFFYWTRRYPELYNNISVQKGKYKLAGHTDYNAPLNEFELFDIQADPYEEHNLVNKNPEMAQLLKTELDRFYLELISSENMVNPPFIIAGSPHENPVFLNRNDAFGERGIWAQEDVYGWWRVHILKGNYTVRFKFTKPVPAGGSVYLETGAIIHQMKNDYETDVIEMKNVVLPELKGELTPFYSAGNKRFFPFWVELERTDLN